MGLLTSYLYEHHPRIARYRKHIDTLLGISWWVALFLLMLTWRVSVQNFCLMYNESMFKMALINSNCSIPYNFTFNLSASLMP